MHVDPQKSVEVAAVLRGVLADAFNIYVKTKHVHWRLTGQQFRDYHLELDEYAGQILEITEEICERVRDIGGTTFCSIRDIARHQRLRDSDNDNVTWREMFHELHHNANALCQVLAEARQICGDQGDLATSALIQGWMEASNRRSSFLAQACARF